LEAACARPEEVGTPERGGYNPGSDVIAVDLLVAVLIARAAAEEKAELKVRRGLRVPHEPGSVVCGGRVGPACSNVRQ
jgi:hypothetical protein